MSIKRVLKMGNMQLVSPSVELADFARYGFAYPGLRALIEDMHDTMEERGGVGIAAPQIGCTLRVVMFGFEQNARYPNEQSVPLTILINPKITILSDETTDGWEGCLSVPGLRGLVTRYNRIAYSGFDETGKTLQRTAEGFHARMVQHECDHLDGILYPHRLKDLKHFGFEDEIAEGRFQ